MDYGGLNATDKELGKQNQMPDYVECLRYVQGDGPTLFFEIVGLQSLLREEQKHVQS